MKDYLLILSITLVLGFFIGWYTAKGHKSQIVRLGDIFIFGPFLIWLGLREKTLWIKIILLFLGISTLSYNLKNYIENLQ